jgi:hypothetical protein
MSAIIDGLLMSWNKNLDYGTRLVADLSDEQMIAQPNVPTGVIVNHPAWVFSHLNIYIPIIAAMVEGRAFDDPREHPFGMTSRPQLDQSLYASKVELLRDFTEGHQRVHAAMKNADESLFERDTPLERWRATMPKLGFVLPYLMLLHENQHLGQVSAWRRAQGLPSV